MNNLFLLPETYTNGFWFFFVEFSSIASVISAIAVISCNNPIVSVLCLIALFINVSCYLLLLGLSFISLSYLLVYVGAVSILFLFILMLINVRISELFNETSNSIPLAITVGISFIYAAYKILPFSITTFNTYTLNINDYFRDLLYYNFSDYYKLFRIFQNKNKIFCVTGKTWDGSLSETTHITSIGNIIYTSYSIWLILTSMILLLAMVGAIVITIKQKN